MYTLKPVTERAENPGKISYDTARVCTSRYRIVTDFMAASGNYRHLEKGIKFKNICKK